MPEAARLQDPIAHSAALGGLIAGAIIGGLVATAIVLTAPVSVPALIGGAAIAGGVVVGAGVGELLGSLSFSRSRTGMIDSPGSPTVLVNGRKAARAHLDTVVCSNHAGKPVIAQGSATVFIDGQPAARKGDLCACGAKIDDGSANVIIGGETATTDGISPEVPGYVHGAMLVVGLASAAILVGPAAAALGLVGGAVGGTVMNSVGGAIFGEGSDGQKLMAFGGGLVGGYAGGRVGVRTEALYIPGSSPAVTAARRATAEQFYRNAGWADQRIADHVSGIDFTQPVRPTNLQPGTPLVQHVGSNGRVGNYFAPPGTRAEQLGINPAGRTETAFTPNASTLVLRSAAAPIVDTWTVPGVPYAAEGGGIQYFAPNPGSFARVGP